MRAEELIEQAFSALSRLPGFVERDNQRQLALLLSDCIEHETTGSFEAPTGLGKSLAALIPAIAHAIQSGRRTIIATYTNVLAEQYWRKDLPLALSLFDQPAIRTEFLIGRQRYACLAAIAEQTPQLMRDWVPYAELGIESEFRLVSGGKGATQTWQQIAAPPVCPGRLCPKYGECFYYKARRRAEYAHIVITNHSVVLQDAVLRRASDGELSLLGDYDFLVLDEAHDFAQAAQSSLEFELSESKLSLLGGIAARMVASLHPVAEACGGGRDLQQAAETFKESCDWAVRSLKSYGLTIGESGILAASPEPVWQHPQVRSRASDDALGSARAIAGTLGKSCHGFVRVIQRLVDSWRKGEGADTRKIDEATDAIRNYTMYLTEFAAGCESMFTPAGVAVTYAGGLDASPMLRHDMVGLAEPLTELIWGRGAWACLSATLALDGNFEFFTRTTGAKAEFEEVLPSPFDFQTQAALYMPPAGTIPDPALARQQQSEEVYFDALAAKLAKIIFAMEGRTLALFHSRREMEAVRERIELPEDLPILMQRSSGVASVGQRFIRDQRSTLFALRSFWTGFDAPGDTLSCVALVRVPFEVPIDPPQVARLAWLQTLGMDAFGAHSLPMAKMIMRQGAGRLIRRAGDKGIIALLDPRLQTKRYGEEIIQNLPTGMRTFRDIYDAIAHVGLSETATKTYT
jgi:ATP-dependent DNA helicase DinG